MPKCCRCGKEFDLFRFGAPGNPNRNICWECEPPHYANPTKARPVVSYSELDYAEGRCLGDIVD